MTRLAAMSMIALAAAACPVAAVAQDARQVLPLESGWEFHNGDLTDEAKHDHAKADWQSVNLPHTWNRVGFYLHDKEGSGTNRAATINKRQGIGWYSLDFTPAANLSRRRNWLEFDGASRVAKVWLNDIYLGEHRGGFSRFRFDASKALRPGQPNKLVVQVDNSPPSARGNTAHILPLAGDFFVHGGLYRPARLVSVAPLHIDMGDAGGSGVYATTRSASASAAVVGVRVRLANDAKATQASRVRIALIDTAGREVAQSMLAATVSAGAVRELSADLSVASPHLWQGTPAPYLYRLSVAVLGRDGSVLDKLEQPFGIRTMAFDPERGFLLNGQPYRLRGVGYHQDRDGKGWAITRADVEEDVATIREMGANSIRLTHYQHGPDIHEIADREGIVLWDEIPLVSVWTEGKPEPDPALVANARQQLSELVRQNYNHASTALWSIANEVDFGNSMPFFLTGKGAPDPMPLLGQLNALAKQEDPSRPTALATCCEGRLFAPDVSIPVTATAADLGGANRYFGWYFGQPADLGPHLDGLRAARPQQPLSVTEYGAGGALSIHTDNALGGNADSRGRAQPEEYESYIHEVSLPQIEARPYLFGSWLWNSFDFATTIRAEGDGQDINTKGLVAYDHKTRKDAWYLYKANWSDAPTVRITGRRYVDRAYAVTDVKVYSNLDSTELLLNGRSLGMRQNCPDRICVWSQVRLDSGANRIDARGRNGKGRAEDSVAWTLDPARQDHVAIDSGALVAAKGNGRLLGSDNWFSGGTAGSLDNPADYGRPAKTVAIADTGERDAMATFRSGTFSYTIPVPAGRYALTLWFPATAGQPVGTFDVLANGKRLLRGYQPPAPPAGTSAVARRFDVRAKGPVVLDFKAGSGDARVSLIELTPKR